MTRHEAILKAMTGYVEPKLVAPTSPIKFTLCTPSRRDAPKQSLTHKARRRGMAPIRYDLPVVINRTGFRTLVRKAG